VYSVAVAFAWAASFSGMKTTVLHIATVHILRPLILSVIIKQSLYNAWCAQ